MRVLKMINATVDSFFTDQDDRNSMKLYLYQSVADMTQTRACEELGITSKRGSFLSKLRINLCRKQNPEFRDLAIECERVCVSEFNKSNVKGYQKHRNKIQERSDQRYLHILEFGVPSLTELHNQKNN
ncbi:MAG: hypothetical protein ACI9JN_001276 [Bacteroidia bacterium]|jgi:hypothetical protein